MKSVLLICLFLIGFVCGQIQWTDANNTESWDDALDWNTTNVPTTNDNVYIQNFNLTITATAQSKFKNLWLQNSLGLTFLNGFVSSGNISLYSGSFSPVLLSLGDVNATTLSLYGPNTLNINGNLNSPLYVVNGTSILRNANVPFSVVIGSTLQLDNVTATGTFTKGNIQLINGGTSTLKSVSSGLSILSGTLRITSSNVVPTLTLTSSTSVLFLASGTVLNVTSLFNWNAANSMIVSDGWATLNLLNTTSSFLTASNLILVNVSINNYGNAAMSGSLSNNSLWTNQVGSCCLYCFGSAGLNCVPVPPKVINISQDTYNTVITATVFFIVGLILLPVAPILTGAIYNKCKASSS